MQIALPQKKYNVIYADPPWKFHTYSHRGKGRSPNQHYDCMDAQSIRDLNVGDIAAQDAVLFLWVVQAQLEEAFALIKAWGFTFKTVAYTWVKIKGGQDRLFYASEDVRMGMGYHTRAGCEQMFLATRGKGYKRFSMGEPQVLLSPLREHSRKPDEIITSIERLVGDVPRIELFARTRRDGWDAWGNEIDKFVVAA